MRRPLTALFIACLVAGLLPLTAIASVPTPDDNTASTDEDTAVGIVLTATDSEADVTDFATTDPTHGDVVSTGSIDCNTPTENECAEEFTYTPDEDYNGSDSFTFTATSDGSQSVSATVSITVDAVNDDPTFTVGGDVTVNEDSGSSSDSTFINDGSPGPSDESGQTLSYTVEAANSTLFVSQPAISSSGGLSFTPAADAHGTTSVSVRLDDSSGASSGTESFAITITSDNDAPSFTKGPNVIAPNVGEATRSGWATNITDGGGESDDLAFVLEPANPGLFTDGPAVSASTGDLTFTPSGAEGSTSVQVTLGDDGTPAATSATQSFTITILDGPAADPQSVTVAEDSAGNAITLTGTDPEDDPLTFDVATQPAHGTLSGTEPDLTYTPDANFIGTDTFTYTATDGTDTSPAATVTITVTSGDNDPVLAKNDAVAVKATVTTVLNPMANDSGGAGETLAGVTITAVTQPGKGSATITHGGARVTYDPAACTTGGDVFSYTISDGSSTSTKSVAVTINRPGQGGNSTSPLTDTPETKFVTNSTMGTTIPLRVTWCGVTTSATSVRSHRVQQSTNSGSTYPTTLFSATTGKSTTRNVSKDQDYRWRVRTVDTAGRTGSYRTSPVSIVRRYQDNSSRITYSSGWGTSSAGSPSGGTERFTKTAGTTASITVTNVRAFAIVGPRSSTRGSFKVYVDNTLVATVSEHASSTVYRRVLYWKALTSGTGVSHTIRIESSSSTRVDLDAILTLAAQ